MNMTEKLIFDDESHFIKFINYKKVVQKSFYFP